LSGYIAVVFIQSLFFKFNNSPETQYIFGTLNSWGASLGFAGLFAPSGIFSQYLVGTAELIASTLLVVSLWKNWPLVHALGAALSMGVISGAIFFHLFTPLGVQVLNADGSLDGGELFGLACGPPKPRHAGESVDALRSTVLSDAPFSHNVSVLTSKNAEGTMVIYVHGTPGEAEGWVDYVVEPVAGSRTRVLDRPGFGKSSPDAAVMSLAAHAAQCE